jgi:hypothetical protein
MRLHNEYFRTVSLGGRKSCPNCRTKLEHGESIWSWGNYIIGKWCTVKYFCWACATEEVLVPLIEHRIDCGCDIALVGYQGEELPKWLRLQKTEQCSISV